MRQRFMFHGHLVVLSIKKSKRGKKSQFRFAYISSNIDQISSDSKRSRKKNLKNFIKVKKHELLNSRAKRRRRRWRTLFGISHVEESEGTSQNVINGMC